MNKTFTYVNSQKLVDLIKLTETKLVLISAGISNEVAIAIVQQINEKKISSFEIILDSNPESIRYGYGQIEAIKTLEKFNVKIRVQKGIRIGIIITDDVSLMFTPTPLNLEEELNNDSTPNAIYLSDTQVEDVLQSLDPTKKGEKQEIEIGTTIIKKEEIKAIEKDLEERPPIKPDLERQMRVISSVFQFVDTEFKGARIFNNSFSLTGRDLGIRDEKLASRISARYQLFNQDQVMKLKEEFDLESVLNTIKDAFLKKIPNYGSVLHYQNAKKFEEAIESFKSELEIVKPKIEELFSEMLSTSRKELFIFIKENLTRNYKTDELKRITRRFSIDEFINIYLDKKMKSTTNTITIISFTLKITNVSTQLINDEVFRKGIEKSFGKKFDEIVKIESAVGANQQEELFN